MKKSIILTVTVIIITALFIFFYSQRKQTIEEILKINFNDISYIKVNSNQDRNYNVNSFIKKYKNKKYRKFRGKKGSTANLYYTCYSKDDKIIFQLIDVGNNNLIILRKGNSSKNGKLYKQVDC